VIARASDQKLLSTKSKVVAKYIGEIGWGLFAEAGFAPGDPICWLKMGKTVSSWLLPWADSFGQYFERSFTVVPDFAWCPSCEHPFWYINHSCQANSGFVNWGRPIHGSIPIIAYRRIVRGQQITMDYSLMTASYDGSPDGKPWSMTPCLCGESDCRGTITGFNRLPFDVQREAIRADAEFPGLVLAHILMDMPALVRILQQASPLAYLQYLDVLHRQVTLSMRFFKAAHPRLLLAGAGLYTTGSTPARKPHPSPADGELLTGYSSGSSIGLGQPY
jgi:hypothetical protein